MKTNWPAIRIGCLVLASAGMSSSGLLAQTEQPVDATPVVSVISNVAVMQAPQQASVRVQGEGPLEVRAARMQDPERLVLDFTATRLSVRKTVIPGLSEPVRGVRMAQFRPDVARVVIDLTAKTPYEILREGSAVVIAFAAPGPSESGALVTDASYREPEARSGFSYDLVAPRPTARVSKTMKVAAPRFSLPGELTQPSSAMASFGGNNEPLRPTPQQAAVQQAGQAAATVANSQAQAPTPAPPPPVAGGKYTGEPISVNLKDVDLKDFFRLIHEISGLNVVLDPAVHGSLTIVLDEVPWDQALDIVLQNNGLDKQLSGNVLRIATRDTLKREAEVQRDLEKAQAEAVAPVTVTRVLSYAKAGALTNTLKKFLSSRGDILADDRSNQLIIRDIPSVIPVVDNLIHQLDRKSQQVEIEARVVAASRSFAQDIGTELGFAGTTTGGRSLFSGSPAVGGSGVVPGAGIPPNPVSVASGVTSGNNVTTGLPLNTFLSAGAPTSGFGFSHRSPNFALDLFITASEAKGVGKLLSKPRVITQNNEKASIKQGQKIPVQTNINNTISVQFIDAVLKLEVTPQITAEGTIFMDVVVENTQIDQGIPRIQGVPALDTQAEETKVLVADGGTVVIGGIIVSTQNTNIQEVPFVGSLPLIGRLFKRNTISVSSQELLFFLTPKIIPG
jgi:type IV pilus assembly protein PilQ